MQAGSDFDIEEGSFLDAQVIPEKTEKGAKRKQVAAGADREQSSKSAAHRKAAKAAPRGNDSSKAGSTRSRASG